MKTDTYKKLISFILALMLVVSASALAFADDDSASVPEVYSGSAAELSEAENEFLSKSTSESDFEVRKVIINSVRSIAPPNGNETASDIYELLYSCWTSINLHYSLYVYDDQNYSVNNDIRTAINAIVSSLQGTTGSATGDIWNLLKQIINALTLDTNSNVPGDYTIHHNVDLISQFIANGLFDSNQNPFLQGITSNLTTVSANLASQMNQIVVIRNKIDSIDSNVDYIEGYAEYISEATEMVIIPRIEHIDSDLHDLKHWFEDTFYYIDESISQSDYISRINLNRYGGPNGVYSYPFTGNIFASMPNDGGLKCIIPLKYIINNHCIVCFPLNENVQVSISNIVSNLDSYNCSLYEDRQYFQIPTQNFSNLNIEYTDYILKIEFDINDDIINQYNYMYFVIGKKASISGYVENMTPYTFTVVNEKKSYIEHIDNDLHLGYDILNTFKELYASDDLINAKENQQELEDSVLEDFTGSGSASASISDAVDIKGVQSSIKGTLNTGDVNASGLSTILDTDDPSDNDSFFKFWTQDVYNDVNGINNIPQTRGGDTYIFLNDSDELDRLIRGQSW